MTNHSNSDSSRLRQDQDRKPEDLRNVIWPFMSKDGSTIKFREEPTVFFPGLWAELWEDSSSRIVEDSSKNSWIRTQTEMSCKKCNLLIWKRTYFYTALLECGTVTWWKEWSIVVHMTWWSRLPTHMIHVSSGTSTLSWRQIAMFLVGGLYDAHTLHARLEADSGNRCAISAVLHANHITCIVSTWPSLYLNVKKLTNAANPNLHWNH